jgi:hypothetical protein
MPNRSFSVLNSVNLFGLVCGVAGGIMLSSALTLRPTNFRLVQTKDGTALCLKDKTVSTGFGGPLIVTDDPCPDTLHTGPTPEVLTNRPRLARTGFWLVIAGFIFQVPAALMSTLNRGIRNKKRDQNRGQTMKLVVLHDAEINADAIEFIHPNGNPAVGSIITFRGGETLESHQYSPEELKDIIEASS